MVAPRRRFIGDARKAEPVFHRFRGHLGAASPTRRRCEAFFRPPICFDFMWEASRIALLAGALSKGVTPAFASGAPVAIGDRAQLRAPIVAASDEDAGRRAARRASQRGRAANQRILDESRKAKRSR